jgi:2-haloacid dehalogenase
MSDIRHIVLDIGQVLVHYDPHLGYLELIPDEAQRTAFLRDVCTHDWNIAQDRGRTWAEAEAEAIALHPDKAELIRAFRKNHSMMIPHAYDDSVAILDALLGSSADVTFLTNFASDTFRETQARFPFLKKGRGVTVSGDVRVIKPDPEIYAIHTKSFGLDPAATLFFDDNPANVEGARAFGWKAELFKSAEGMREDLKRYGIME